MKNKRNVKPKLNIENLENIKETQQVLDMYIEEVDENLNMIGKVGKDIKAIIPRDEASSVVGDDGLVEEKYIVNKKGKVLPVCIKEIVKNDSQVELIMSKKILELKVRKWMYMHLKPGVKLRGIVVGLKDYAAFVDVGGGVTGILKLQDMSDSILTNSADMFKLGQRIEVIVKKYDRDTGRIELSYKELLGTFEDNVKKFKEGDIVDGIVRNRIKTGVFVELMPNIIGIAEHVNGIEYGQKVLVSIKKINLEKKKIKLIIIG
ncbi:MAG: S1 RNA-binding domain-containing protein [Clostridia bacterium]|nr:S1 RNA-binding domain-containing protein [Clostridia bacterium]